ncbi:MAG: RNA polymerase factor sigma-54 [Deltaproteobacteria bacterium]|nr:RNA polymerase factor sigma-54 [Deltaproteobacteria bacterium]
MGLDLRLQQKMTQQLVMTPQLQQAIKLLQLSHLELADVLQKELEENPVLEEPTDSSDDSSEIISESSDSDDRFSLTQADNDNSFNDESNPEQNNNESSENSPSNTEVNDAIEILSDIKAAHDNATELGASAEPTANEVNNDMDWEAYLDSYSYSLPASVSPSGIDDLPPFESTLTKSLSLAEHLRWQIQMGDFSETETHIASLLIEEIDEDGYLAENAVANVADELEITIDEVAIVLAEIQQLDPVGVGARDLRECLLIQATHLAYDDPLITAIIDRHLKNVEKRNFGAIAKDLGVSLQKVSQAVKTIAQFEPRPGSIYTDREPQYISPDIYVYKVGDEYVIQINEDGMPRLRVSNYYRGALSNSGGETKNYIQDKLKSAAWLIRSIHMRQRTIYRVMESILKFQRDFFDKGVSHLKPLILKDVAEDLEMHESTISRVTTNKYVHTPQGIYELKYFFNSSIHGTDGENVASESVRDHIKHLIDEENPKAPCSDQEIAGRLKKHGINIARRTVAKYREMMRIPSSSKRRQMF